MELRQLEYLIAVAEEASFTRAAERVRISQSGVSAQIRHLEHELGAELIDRSGRAATLTGAGEAAISHARAALAAVNAVRQSVDDVGALVRGRLVVGMVTACTVAPLFDALAAFHRAHPGVTVSLLEDNSDRLIERVRTGTLDLALIGTAGAVPTDLNAMPIISEGLAAAVPPGHPLDRGRARLADVCAFPIVCLPAGTGIRTVFDQACASAGLRPDIALQATAPDAVADLAARGLGVAVLSESMVGRYADRLRPVPIEDVDIPAILALVWGGPIGPAGPGSPAGPRSPVSPALRELLAHCGRAFDRP